ncbi:MAG: AMP-binding protein, partial [candidate division NC10 bacterium]|nr:AMP-binding protein [candidate division NC10 bacterium]
MTLGDLLRRATEKVPRKTAAIYREHRLSYEALHERTNQLANALLRLGLEKGDRLAVLIDNSHYAYEVIMGAAKAGIVLVPLNYMLKGRELSAIIRHAGARALIVGKNHWPTVDGIRHELSSVKEWIVIGEGDQGVQEYEALIREASSGDPSTPLEEDDLFALLYTSGTTGLPKGTMLTHRNILANVENAIREYRIDEDSVGFTVLPYFVGATLNCIHFPCLYQGGTMVFERFSPRRFLEVIQEERVTHVQVVPTILIRLLESGDLRHFRWDSLKTLGYGSAPMPVDRLKQALQVFGPILLQIYGLTETTAMSTCLPPESHTLEGEGSKRLASCGRPVKGVEVKVVDEAGKEVAPGEVGEIIIRGPTVMKGYW